MDFVTTHFTDIVNGATALIAAASAIANIFNLEGFKAALPTINKVVNFFALNFKK